jgi:hypothetical protein
VVGGIKWCLGCILCQKRLRLKLINMIPSTELQCHPYARGTLIFVRTCSQRANRASLTPRSWSEGISNQLLDIFCLAGERRSPVAHVK